MVNYPTPKDQVSLDVATLKQKIEQLQQQVQQVLQEKADLEILLNTVTNHSDQLLSDVEQEKIDLEILLETSTEHSTLVETDLQTQVEEERQQREQQFQLITAATPVGLLISQATDSRILYANEALAKLIGISAAELVNHQASSFYAHPEIREQLLSQATKEQYFQGEMLLKRADGTPFWALVSLRPFVFQGLDTLLTSVLDISDRKQAEESLRIAEAKFRGIFENAIEGIFQTTLDGRYMDVNPAMAAMFGYPSPGAMLAEVTNIGQQIYLEENARNSFIQMLNEHGEIRDFEYQVKHCSGHTFWVSEWARSVYNESGELLYYEGSCVDITKRKQEEESLRQQIRELRIEIDQSKRKREVAEIEKTDYFQWLVMESDKLRNKRK